MMAMSKEAIEAVEAIRRDLKVYVSVEHERGNFYDSPCIRVKVTLTLADEVLSESESFASLPDARA
jgi:hypothetical protein